MKAVYSSLGFAIGASAAAIAPRAGCSFSLTAAGGVSGVVGQLSDGQNRIAQTSGLATTTATYTITNGGLTDENNRGCILTPPTTQFQCDTGASPTTGFSVNSNGELEYNGSTSFKACATGDEGGYNIYTTTTSAESNCVDITLSTGGQCAASSSSSAVASSSKASSATSSAPASTKATSAATSAPASSAPASSAPATVFSTVYHTSSCAAPSTVTSTVYVTVSESASSVPATSAAATSAAATSAPAATSSKAVTSTPASSVATSSAKTSFTTASACQTSLTGSYQTPHAIIPVNSAQPSKSYGTQYDATIGSGNSTIFNFDIPSSYSGKQCTILFLLPTQAELETSSFTLSGTGSLTFEELVSAAPLDVTYSSCPATKETLGTVETVTPGNSYVISTGACAAGTTESIEVSASGDLALEFFEDWNPSSIGVYITAC